MISLSLVKELAVFFSQFGEIFDSIELADKPNIQKVLPTFYLVTNHLCKEVAEDHSVIKTMKENVKKYMLEKYWPDVNVLHTIATLLDPSFSTLQFIAEDSDRKTLLDDAMQGMRDMCQVSQKNADSEVVAAFEMSVEPPIKKTKADPFDAVK